jgi:hypothetical protein
MMASLPYSSQNEGRYVHQMRDHCWTWAPFWERYPICPHCESRLKKSGRTKCSRCKVFVLADPADWGEVTAEPTP